MLKNVNVPQFSLEVKEAAVQGCLKTNGAWHVICHAERSLNVSSSQPSGCFQLDFNIGMVRSIAFQAGFHNMKLSTVGSVGGITLQHKSYYC
jgi:hypothetical protein